MSRITKLALAVLLGVLAVPGIAWAADTASKCCGSCCC